MVELNKNVVSNKNASSGSTATDNEVKPEATTTTTFQGFLGKGYPQDSSLAMAGMGGCPPRHLLLSQLVLLLI